QNCNNIAYTIWIDPYAFRAVLDNKSSNLEFAERVLEPTTDGITCHDSYLAFRECPVLSQRQELQNFTFHPGVFAITAILLFRHYRSIFPVVLYCNICVVLLYKSQILCRN